MCLIDDSDGTANVLREQRRTARQPHRCSECCRTIAPGEKYLAEAIIFDGGFCSYKTCEHCQVVRDWLTAECGGFIWSGVREDIEDHARSGHYGFGVHRLAAGVLAKWKRKDGRAWPLPALPDATHKGRMA